MSSEIWEDIPGYQGLYQVSTLGRILRMPKEQIRVSKFGKEYTQLVPKHPVLMNPAYDFDGYLQISLTKDSETKSYQVHRLVAMTFIPNPENKSQVNHIDGVKDNNKVSNLQWVTQSENIRHSVDVLGNQIGFKKGSHKSEEHKRKISETMSGRVLPEWHVEILKKAQNDPETRFKSYVNDPRRKPVKCLEDGKIYPSALYASKEYNVSDSSISYAIKEKRKVKKKWTFVISDIDPWEQYKKKEI